MKDIFGFYDNATHLSHFQLEFFAKICVNLVALLNGVFGLQYVQYTKKKKVVVVKITTITLVIV